MIVDGSDPNTANFVQNYAQGVLRNWREQSRRQDGSSPTRPPAIFGRAALLVQSRSSTSRYFLVPGSIAIVMTLIGTLLTALVVAREWERGTMEAMMATPVDGGATARRQDPALFRARAHLDDALRRLPAVFLFGVPFRGSLAALYALSAAFLAGARPGPADLGGDQEPVPRLAAGADRRPSCRRSCSSGFLFEINSMPVVIQWITSSSRRAT